MATKSFDLIEALKSEGFTCKFTFLDDGWTEAKLSKYYGKDERVNDWGYLNADFWVDVTISFEPYHGAPTCVCASYSNGKCKYHKYDKRAYNAIRDTVRYNGFEL